MTQENNSSRNKDAINTFRGSLSAAYCWSAPIGSPLDPLALQLEIFQKAITGDLVLACQYYGCEAMREALLSCADRGLILDEALIMLNTIKINAIDRAIKEAHQ